ncbi:MAG: aldolase/citrate lyase family protein [Pseudomonadota bacterium]
MRPNIIRQRLAEGDIIINGWLSIGSSYSAEGMGHAGYHSVTVDLQHGMLDFSTALPMLQAISATPALPMVRVPELNEAQIIQVLDAGAYGVICPMISTPQQAAQFAAACRYPPHGTRSFGPSRGLLYGGGDYVEHANSTVMAIPMIETEEALDNIDAIVQTDGVDMIYVGPNDLAYSLANHGDSNRARLEKAIAHIRSRAAAHGVPTGIFCAHSDEASARLREGFNLVTPSNDFGHLMRSNRSAVTAILDGWVGPGEPAVAMGG